MIVDKFSVIIVSYNNMQVLSDCLDSLYKFNDIGDLLEVIIIDNSTDSNLYDYVKTHYKKVKIKKNNNKGFGEANNIGAKMARSEYILFLNPDTILVEPIFEFAIKKFEAQKELALFGFKLIDTNKNSRMSFYFIDKPEFIYNLLIKLCNKWNIFIDGKMFISGANMFVRKKIFMDCGMFDEKIFMYSEESDLIRRIKKMGWKTSFFNEKSIIHLEGKSSEVNEKAVRMRLISKKYYSKKHNLNFEYLIKKEIQYGYAKYLFCKFYDRKRSIAYKKHVSTLKEFLEKGNEE